MRTYARTPKKHTQAEEQIGCAHAHTRACAHTSAHYRHSPELGHDLTELGKVPARILDDHVIEGGLESR